MRFEVGVMATIDHPNIVKFIETYEDTRYLFIVMQKCEGGNIFDNRFNATKHGLAYNEKQSANIIK